MLAGFDNMGSKVGPAPQPKALEPNNAKKSTFFWRFLTFGAYFSAVLGPNGPKLGGNLGPALIKGPAYPGPLTQKKSAILAFWPVLGQNGPKKWVFWDFGALPPRISTLVIK